MKPGETDLIDVGCTVWALDLNVDVDLDVDHRQVQGGIVVAIETAADPDTGELQRRFVTATPWQGRVRWDSLLASQVAQIAPPNTAAIRSLIRACAGVVAKSKRVMATDEARCIAAQYRLMETLA